MRAASADIEAKVYEGCDVALVDPPRAGLDERTREVVAQMEQSLSFFQLSKEINYSEMMP